MTKPEDFVLHMSKEEWEHIRLLGSDPAKTLALIMSELADVKARLHVVTTLLALSLDSRVSGPDEMKKIVHDALEEGYKKYRRHAASRLVTMGQLESLGAIETNS